MRDIIKIIEYNFKSSSLKNFFSHIPNYFISSFGIKILSFISIPILTRLLTPEEYGEVSFLVSVAAFASTLSMVGAYNSIVVLTSKNVKIQATINFISSCVGIVSGIIVFSIVDKIEVGLLIFSYIFIKF